MFNVTGTMVFDGALILRGHRIDSQGATSWVP